MLILRNILFSVVLLWTSGAIAQAPVVVAEGKFLHISDTLIEAGPIQQISQFVGIARNLSNEPMSNVFIEINLYDANNVLLGNTIAHGMNLASGGAWKFSAPITIVFHHAVISKVTAYK